MIYSGVYMNKCRSGKHGSQSFCKKTGLNCKMIQLRRSVNEIWKLLECRQKEKRK